MGAKQAPFTLVMAAALAALPACHSNDASSDGSVTADVDFIDCRAEPRAMPYGMTPIRMQKTSSSGAYVLKLLSNTFTDPSGTRDEPPAKGVDVWTIEIDRADTAAPVDGLTVTVSPYMPDHGHGTTPVGVTPVGSGGQYTIAPLNLYMAGYWEITFRLVDPNADAGASETAMLPICVPD